MRTLTWFVLSALIGAALVLASCGPAPATQTTPATPATPATPTTPAKPVTPTTPSRPATPTLPAAEGPETIKVTLKKVDGTAVEKLVEKPQYGGVFTGLMGLVTRWDAVYGIPSQPAKHIYESLLMGDWSRGPAGTGERSWMYRIMNPKPFMVGALAEDWELPDDNTLVFHIRKGVRWHNKAPTNGREMTADDVAFTFNRLWDSPRSYENSSYPRKTYIESIAAPDKWTVVVKTLPGKMAQVYEVVSGFTPIMPRDAVERFGDLEDWRNAIGTGPWILTDFVDASSATFAKNPNYWMKDPIFPDNQLPYMDGFKLLSIPDLSTRLSAIRTGKIDWMGVGFELIWDSATSLMKTNPELKWLEYLPAFPQALFYRVDKPQLPFKDIRVRRALNMAIDRKALVDSYFSGRAEMLAWPIAPVAEWLDMYVPLDQLSSSIQELFEYHPDRAKQLLAEAGYPNGFKTAIITTEPSVDILSIVKSYWAKIGVELDIQVKEPAVFNSIWLGRQHPEMITGVLASYLPFKFLTFNPVHFNNWSYVNDPRINEVTAKVDAAYFDETQKRKMAKEISPYLLEQAYLVPLPDPFKYVFWQPWVKNYSGEHTVGYFHTQNNYVNFIWLDQEMKRKMTGR